MAPDFNKLLMDLQSQLGFLMRVIGIIMRKIFERSLLIVEEVDYI